MRTREVDTVDAIGTEFSRSGAVLLTAVTKGLGELMSATGRTSLAAGSAIAKRVVTRSQERGRGLEKTK